MNQSTIELQRPSFDALIKERQFVERHRKSVKEASEKLEKHETELKEKEASFSTVLAGLGLTEEHFTGEALKKEPAKAETSKEEPSKEADPKKA